MRIWKLMSAGLLAGSLAACGGDSPDVLNIDVSAADRCSVLDPNYCLFPWPSDHYTVADETTETGRRVDLALESMPANQQGVRVDPSEWNRNDGFSPNQMLLVRVPGLDPELSRIPRLTDLSASLEPDSPVMVLNARTGEPHPVWAELDAGAERDGQRAFMIRPAEPFTAGERYIAVLRNLRKSTGDPLIAPKGFRVYRDGVPTDVPEIEARRDEMEALFATLEGHGVDRDSLYMAWDFTVASTEDRTDRLLHIRDDAAASLGGGAPAFSVTSVQDFQRSDPDAGDFDEDIARRVEGTFTVPNYLNTDEGGPGSAFFYSSSPADGLPDRMGGDNTLTADFICQIPYAALGGETASSATAGDVTPARPSLYGHGLLGSRSEVGAGNVEDMSQSHDMMFCATDWIGFAEGDAGFVIQALQDAGGLRAFFDRTQQGFVNFEFLARLLHHADGFASDPAFRVDGEPVFDNSDVFYDGNSQGGILGAAFMGISQTVERGVLGVPGMTYSLLLRRSVDFADISDGTEFADIFDGSAGFARGGYPDRLDRTFLLSAMQMLWDRAEGAGYARHIEKDPLPDTPSHQVLLHVAFGDHQVSMWSADILARAIGARRHAPTVVAGRHPDDDPYFGIPAITNPGSFDGSALVVWDNGPVRRDAEGNVIGGTAPPPVTNTPPFPREEFGVDPHGLPRADDDAQRQKSEFLKADGTYVNVCGGEPCTTAGFSP